MSIQFKHDQSLCYVSEGYDVQVYQHGMADNDGNPFADPFAEMLVYRNTAMSVVVRTEFYRYGDLICTVYGNTVYGNTRTTQEFIDALYFPN